MPSYDLSGFVLSEAQLIDVRNAMTARIQEGLAQDGQELKAIPALLDMPSGVPQGDAVALDLGGTNIRAAAISIRGTTASITRAGGQDSTLLDKNKNPTPVTRDQLFDRVAQLVSEAQPEGELNVGFIFSYPCTILESGGAILMRWSKGVDIPDTVGRDVAQLLRDALTKRGRVTKRINVLNDTVSALLAGVVAAPGCSHYIGLIAGTGTNTAGFFSRSAIKKLKPGQSEKKMAVNLETGNFNPPHLTAIDEKLDRENVHDTPGTQRLEKAVSGMYLPQLFAQIVGAAMAAELGVDLKNKDRAGGQLMLLNTRQDEIGEVVRVLVNRSADLLGATIAGLVGAYAVQALESADKASDSVGRVGLLGEGSLYLKNPIHHNRLLAVAQRLSPAGAEIVGVSADEVVGANNIGSACAVLG